MIYRIQQVLIETRDCRLHLITATGVLLIAMTMGMIYNGARANEPVVKRTVQVSGTGTDLQNGAIVHSKKPTANGMVQRGTKIVDLRVT